MTFRKIKPEVRLWMAALKAVGPVAQRRQQEALHNWIKQCSKNKLPFQLNVRLDRL